MPVVGFVLLRSCLLLLSCFCGGDGVGDAVSGMWGATSAHGASAACSELPAFLLQYWSSAGRFLGRGEQRWSFSGAACQPQHLSLCAEVNSGLILFSVKEDFITDWCMPHFIYMQFHLPLYYQVTYSHNIFLLFFPAA